jgi:hypothetical protein
MHTRKDYDNIITEEWIGDKSCIMTIDAEASLMIVRPDITTGFPERELTRPYLLQVASGKTLPILKEAFIELTLEWLPLKTGVFFDNTTNKFPLGMDVLHTQDASMDMGCCAL